MNAILQKLSHSCLKQINKKILKKLTCLPHTRLQFNKQSFLEGEK